MFALRATPSRATLAGVSQVGAASSQSSQRLVAARSLTTTPSKNTDESPVPPADFLESVPPTGSVADDSKPPIAGPDGFPPAKSTIPNPFKDTFTRSSASISSASLAKIIKPATVYRLHCHSTQNNTITTLTTHEGKTVAWFSGGSCGFKKSNRASYEAGYQCAVRMFQKVKEVQSIGTTPMKLEVFLKGFGQGRDALHKALLTSEGNDVRPLVSLITDRTPIKIGGTRAKKTRRL